MSSLLPEELPDPVVPGVYRSQGVGGLFLQVLPEGLGDQGLGVLGRVEAVHGLDELPDLASVVQPVVDDLAEGVLHEVDVERGELLLGGDVLQMRNLSKYAPSIVSHLSPTLSTLVSCLACFDVILLSVELLVIQPWQGPISMQLNHR